MIGPYWRLLAVAALLATSAAQAEVYKWVDEEGVTHYSQQPPPEGTGTLVESDSAPSAAGSDEGAAGDDAGSNGGGEEQDENGEDGPDTVAEFCKGLREKKQTLESDRPVRIKADDGTLTTMNDEQRAQRLQGIQGQIDDHCQDVEGSSGSSSG